MFFNAKQYWQYLIKEKPTKYLLHVCVMHFALWHQPKILRSLISDSHLLTFYSFFSLLSRNVPFLDASTHLYKRVGLSVGRSVGRSVRPSVTSFPSSMNFTMKKGIIHLQASWESPTPNNNASWLLILLHQHHCRHHHTSSPTIIIQDASLFLLEPVFFIFLSFGLPSSCPMSSGSNSLLVGLWLSSITYKSN